MGEELMQSLRVLAERGEPRGAQAVFEDARAEAAGEQPVPAPPTWRRGFAVAFGTAAAALVLVGLALAVTRAFRVEEISPATTDVPVVATSIPTHRGNEVATLNDVNDAAMDSDGHLWVATGAGVVRWDTSEGSYVIFTEGDGLPARAIDQIAVGPDGVAWALDDRQVWWPLDQD